MDRLINTRSGEARKYIVLKYNPSQSIHLVLGLSDEIRRLQDKN